MIFAFMFYRVKTEALENCSSENELAVTLIINSNNINRFSRINDKEFIFDGIRYDIYSQKKTGNDLYILCTRDVKEQNLISLFTKSSDKSESSNTKKSSNSISFKNLIKVYLNPSYKNLFIALNSMQEFIWIDGKYKQPDLDLNSPPPQNT